MQKKQIKKWIFDFPAWFRNTLKTGKKFRFGRTIAISFNENSIQLATAWNIWHRTRLLNATKIYIPRSHVSKEKRRNFVVTEIGRYVEQYGTRLTRYVLGIGSSDSAFRVISLPPMPRRELARAVRWEADKRIPFGLDNAYFGYHLTRTAATAVGESTLVSLIAVSKTEIDDKLQLLQSVCPKIKAVFYELEALGHMLPYIKDYDERKTYALINIKKDGSEISYYRGRRLEFMNISSIGFSALSESPGENKYEAFTESLVNEIQTSLDYYVGQFSKTSTDVVFVYGDLSYSDDLINNLSRHFGIEFRRFPVDCLAESKICRDDFCEQIPVSLSAVALSMIDYDLIDFLPPRVREKLATVRFVRLVVPAFALFVAMLLLTWTLMKYRDEVKSAWLDSSMAQIARFENSQPVIMYNQIKRQMVIDKDILKTLDKEPTHLYLNLKELSRVTPRQIKLNMYDLGEEGRAKNLILAGRAASTDPPPEVILAEFIVRLESSPFFENVALDNHSKSNKGNLFTIDFQISMDAIL